MPVSPLDMADGRLSLNAAVFRTDNKNVIFTVDATTIPPIYNQDDAQLVKGVTLGAMGRITERWEIFANLGYLDSENQSQNSVNNGRRLTLIGLVRPAPDTATAIRQWHIDEATAKSLAERGTYLHVTEIRAS